MVAWAIQPLQSGHEVTGLVPLRSAQRISSQHTIAFKDGRPASCAGTMAPIIAIAIAIAIVLLRNCRVAERCRAPNACSARTIQPHTIAWVHSRAK